MVSDDGLVTMSKMGYVRSCRPPHNDSYTCGLICKYHSAARIAASCHLHPKCAIQFGIARGDDVPRIRLAEWLASGRKMPADATKEERQEAGKEHRRLWVRYPTACVGELVLGPH